MKFSTLDSLGISQTSVHRGLPSYPGRLVSFLGDKAPPAIWMSGNAAILDQIDSGKDVSLALMSSIGFPQHLLDSLLTLIRQLSENNITFVGGFHSQIERCCLDLLLKEDQRIVICLARSLTGAGVPTGWQRSLREGRLVILSPFAASQKRPTVQAAEIRNKCVAALASYFLVPYASPGGKTEGLCRDLITSGKPLWVLDSPMNASLLQFGAKLAGPKLLKALSDPG
jgi:predicted Rossmann fold nucleotide-binding protein DprA/Smf involved in DNA uptake